MTHYNVTDIVDRLRNFALNTLALIPDKLQQYPKTDPDLIIKGFSHQCDLLTEAADTIATLRKQLENAREALDGYRAAVSFISADSWDGCSDCINILKAARCADMTDAMTINETAEHLKRIRLHYDPNREALKGPQ